MMGLRIAWLAPWNERSSIAESASEVAFELNRRGHAVTVFRTEVGEALALLPRPAPGPIGNLADCPAHELRHSFDVVVAHIGDNFGFHGAVPSRLRDIEVVGVFHDAFIANLACHWAGDEAPIRDLLRQTYGEDTWPAGEPFFRDLNEVLRRRPMLEWLARQTVGAVAHAEHYAQRLRDACPGPVTVIPLAHTMPNLPPPPVPWDRLLVGVVGHANPNKRIDQLILAIGASPTLRSRCRIKIVGEVPTQERERLRQLARAAQVEVPEFTGWVTDEELRWQLRDVDVISCLRNPVLEGASGSLVLAQISGRPTLVTNHGSYAEVPADMVLPCAPEHEARDVMRHLEQLLDDPARGAVMGQRARAFALRRHAPAAYVDELLPLLEQVVAQQPELRARRHLANILIGFGLPPDDPSVGRAEAVLASLRARTQDDAGELNSPLLPPEEPADVLMSQTEQGIDSDYERICNARNEGRLIVTEYPYAPRVRPFARSHGGQKIVELLEVARPRFSRICQSILDDAGHFKRIPLRTAQQGDSAPCWINGMQPALDGMVLYTLARTLNPRTYLEVGSGNSTKFVRRAIIDHNLRTKILSIDPHPRADIDRLCDEVIREPFEDVVASRYREWVGPGDMVFIDNSHRSFQNSDVTVFFTEVLPALPLGIVYGIHDIFLPSDYPAEWADRFYNEQYLLTAYLLGGAGGDLVIFPGLFVSDDQQSKEMLQPLFDHPHFSAVARHAGGFWLQKG